MANCDWVTRVGGVVNGIEQMSSGYLYSSSGGEGGKKRKEEDVQNMSSVGGHLFDTLGNFSSGFTESSIVFT